MANLVAATPQGPALSEAYKCFAIIGPAMSISKDFGDGDQVSGIADIVGTGVDTLSAVADPISTLVSSVANFFLTYIHPLPDYIDILVGNPRVVAGMSMTWTNISNSIDQSKADLDGAVQSAIADWTGAASDAYAELAEVVGKLMTAVSSTAAGVAAGLKGASAIIDLIHTIVVQLVSDLVGSLISAAAEDLATAGLGTPAIIVQELTKIAKYITRGREWITKIVAVIRKVAKVVSDVNDTLHVTIPGLKTVGHELTIISIKDLYEDLNEFAENITKPLVPEGSSGGGGW